MNPCFSSPTHGQPGRSGTAADQTRFIIRAAQSPDLISLAEILTDSFHSRAGWMGCVYPFLRMGIYEDLRHRLRTAGGHYACFVAVDPAVGESTDGSPYIVGTVEMTLRSSYSWQCKSFQYPYLSNLAVRRSSRRQGVARQLLTACEGKALEWGFPDLYLHVLENNNQARRLYFKAGYRIQQVDAGWNSWLLGQPRRILLRKRLETSD
ncbi:GNAT family N-acetyltransferase [Microcoleus sp. FACHB-68]|uniref:GNAT family N-acetyltransferase n=1 Tax=Microcoleus sp. FACHB-68 TaxID=2692826 RepID=UPI001681F704|nr:GNAT family N-acetyltransferase [Microcoleus sp. FACHB-68]